MKVFIPLFLLTAFTACSKEKPNETEASAPPQVLTLALPPKPALPPESPHPISTSSATQPARNTDLIEFSIKVPPNPPEKLTLLLEKMKRPDFQLNAEEMEYLRSFEPSTK